MTDGAALPLALSDLVADLRDRKVLDTTITAGHAFGGDLEAVSVPSALALARHVAGADVVIVGMGPGVVGTGSALGTTAVEVAAVLDTVDALGGRGALCVRASEADGRDRHRGISHHVHTVLGLVRSHPIVPVPSALLGEARSLGDGALVEVVDGPDSRPAARRHGPAHHVDGAGPRRRPAVLRRRRRRRRLGRGPHPGLTGRRGGPTPGGPAARRPGARSPAGEPRAPRPAPVRSARCRPPSSSAS